MDNPLIPESKEKILLPKEFKEVVDKYRLKLRPYANHFVYTEENVLYVYQGVGFSETEIYLQFRYTDDSGVFNVSKNIYKYSRGTAEIDTWFKYKLESVQKARIRFIELRAAFEELGVELNYIGNEHIL